MPPQPIEPRALTERSAALFWRHVDREGDGCWLWNGTTDARSGYGLVVRFGRTIRAHRLAYALAHGADPHPLLVLHSCDQRRCVRPDHLRPGDDTENAADRTARGRGHVNPRGRNSTMGSRVVPFRLPAETAERLGGVAAARGVSVSALLRTMVDDLLSITDA